MIIVDDMRPEIASWGSVLAITPNIDELVKRGISFKSICSICKLQPIYEFFVMSPNKLGHEGRYNDF